eukprot:scaffold107993_cov63-Phaeocystis_antarctica.AAC.3
MPLRASLAFAGHAPGVRPANASERANPRCRKLSCVKLIGPPGYCSRYVLYEQLQDTVPAAWAAASYESLNQYARGISRSPPTSWQDTDVTDPLYV